MLMPRSHGETFQKDSPTKTIMEIPANVLSVIVCSKCEQLLRKGPVFQQHDGAAVCGLCQAREDAQPASRCLLYEATAQLLLFPCRYREEGCPATVPFVAAEEPAQHGHEDGCEYRQYVCPVLGSSRCDWSGRRSQLHQHCQEEHPDHILPNPAILTPDIRCSVIKDFIISAFNILFLIHTRVCLTTAKLYYAVRLLGHPEQTSNFTYTVTIKRGIDIITRTRDVLPEELLVLQEHSALNLQTNSLLQLLGGWDGASLSVEVKQRNQADSEQEQEHCGKCGACTPRLYRDERRWLCASCAPEKETCENEDCDFQDFEEKRDKHSWYFCKRRTQCWYCKVALQTNTLEQHYMNCSKLTVIPAGSRFLVRPSNGWQYFLVDTTAGRVVYECMYTQDVFILLVRAPVPSEQLHLYRCEVRLECAGVTRSHTPDVVYDIWWDWKVECKKDNFFSNRDVHVVVNISKKQ